MIRLITGLPGAGKTQFLLKQIRDRDDKERPVYYFGIKITPAGAEALGMIPLGFPETQKIPELYELDYMEYHGKEGLHPVDKWYELPKGSIVVIDEAYNVFPQRMAGKTKFDHVDKLATHRHAGMDIWLCCQLPTQLDKFARTLIGEQYHLIRPFGLEAVKCYRWPRCVDNPLDYHEKQASETFQSSYDKEIYDFYISAELHTHKKKVPRGVLYLAAGIVAFVGVLFVSYTMLTSLGGAAVASTPGGESASGLGALTGGGFTAVKGREQRIQGVNDDFAVSRQAYVAKNTEKLAGLPWTSEFYEGVFQAADYPKPHCIASGETKCRCYTQQVTRITQIDTFSCLYYVKNGFFDPTIERKDSDKGDNTERLFQLARSLGLVATSDIESELNSRAGK